MNVIPQPSSGGTASALDEIDQRVLAALLADSRVAVSRLAQSIDLSGTATQYRLTRLLNRGVMTIHGYVDPAYLGRPLQSWIVATTTSPQVTAEAMAGHDEFDFVSWCDELSIATGHGAFSDNVPVIDLVNRVIRGLAGVERVEVVIGMRVHAIRPRFWGPATTQVGLDWIREATPRSLDEVDLQIARALREDGRLPFAEVGRRIGISPGAARKRYLALTRRGTLRVRTFPSPERLGFHGRGQVNVVLREDPARLIERLIRRTETLYVFETTGAFDLRVALVCRSFDDFDELVEHELSDASEVEEFQVERYSGVAKEYAPPVV
jgi:Lrp/AsnC family transcriptional regulator for asnA, asnC and gidA